VLRDAVRGAGEEWSKGADVVFDTVGGDVGQQALRATAFGARICIVGWTSTPFAGGGRGAGADHATGTCVSLLHFGVPRCDPRRRAC
jgi:NADPH:quinone reductase-like Zn-dependent oxidoreductase